MPLTVVQVLPALDGGGVEQGTIEVARELVMHGHRAIVVAAGGRMVPQLLEVGAEHVPWPIGGKSPLTLRYLAPLRRLLRHERVDILHARSRAPAWLAYLAWRSLPAATRPRFVTTVHGPYRVNRYSAIMARGERVIAISKFIRDYILAHYPFVDPTRIRLIYRGVDPARFPHGYQPPAEWSNAWKREQPRLAGKRIITLPARITRWKGQEDFIELIAELKSRGTPAHGLIVGGAARRRERFLAELRAGVRRRGLGNDITFLGHRSDLREIMAVSDLVLSLSRDPEAFGRTTLEALSLGVPLIGYDHGGVGEILDLVYPEGRTPVGDLDRLVGKTMDFISRPRSVPSSGAFALQRMLDDTLELYGSLARS